MGLVATDNTLFQINFDDKIRTHCTQNHHIQFLYSKFLRAEIICLSKDYENPNFFVYLTSTGDNAFQIKTSTGVITTYNITTSADKDSLINLFKKYYKRSFKDEHGKVFHFIDRDFTISDITTCEQTKPKSSIPTPPRQEVMPAATFQRKRTPTQQTCSVM